MLIALYIVSKYKQGQHLQSAAEKNFYFRQRWVHVLFLMQCNEYK